MTEETKAKEGKKRWGNFCLKCGKEHENMGVEICDCGGRTDIILGPPERKAETTGQNYRIIPL
ncbi:MAG: hypothetical protein A2Y67_00290 [Candidatus Buchananbacteria bacterium RBG_13_39_9]|uniref:Uncharacterized protein n=1 Tax=Candidatus Buchananbacteria bacterium RBG_13_39_9 TaxID=1797531 RepID=A0A1G1XS58_9BACT|nr:MAG: hypothetical protein A2Y67_00290 [Candidatus Buchananbacteria bacterium RBG_13_39_9]